MRKRRSPLPNLGLFAHGVSAVPLVLGLYRFFQMQQPLESRLDLLRWDEAGPCWLVGVIATGVGAALISKPPHAQWLVPLGVVLTYVTTMWGVIVVLAQDGAPGPLLAWLPVLVLWTVLAVLVYRAREWVIPEPEPEPEAPSDEG